MPDDRVTSRIVGQDPVPAFLELGADASFRLIYQSRLGGADDPLVFNDLGRTKREIAEVSARNNAAEGLSGILIERQGLFLQVLEGPGPALERVFERICRDRRHTDLTLYDYAEIRSTAFPAWSMRYLASDDLPGEYRESVEDIFLEICATATGDDIVTRIDGLLGNLDATLEAQPPGAAAE